MNDWFEQQEFFTQARMDRINAWIKQEPFDVFVCDLTVLREAV
jgi:hypothetical protein